MNQRSILYSQETINKVTQSGKHALEQLLLIDLVESFLNRKALIMELCARPGCGCYGIAADMKRDYLGFVYCGQTCYDAAYWDRLFKVD